MMVRLWLLNVNLGKLNYHHFAQLIDGYWSMQGWAYLLTGVLLLWLNELSGVILGRYCFARSWNEAFEILMHYWCIQNACFFTQHWCSRIIHGYTRLYTALIGNGNSDALLMHPWRTENADCFIITRHWWHVSCLFLRCVLDDVDLQMPVLQEASLAHLTSMWFFLVRGLGNRCWNVGTLENPDSNMNMSSCLFEIHMHEWVYCIGYILYTVYEIVI